MNESQQQLFLDAYDNHADEIFRFCLVKVRNRDLALDIMQDTFMKTWEYLTNSNNKEVDNMRAFLFQVARYRIIDWSRKKKSDSLETILEAGGDFDSGESTQDKEDKFDAKKAVALIDNLPEKYRDSMYFRYVEDMSVQEIAEILGEKENTISVRLHRGVKTLEENFTETPNEDDIEHEA